MIVKIQRELAPSEDRTLLVYDRSRTFQTVVAASPEILELMGDADKVYAEASIIERRLQIHRRVPAQAW